MSSLLDEAVGGREDDCGSLGHSLLSWYSQKVECDHEWKG